MYDPLMLVIHAFVVIGIIAILVKVFQNGSKMNKARDLAIRECRANVAELKNQIAQLEEFNKLLMGKKLQ